MGYPFSTWQITMKRQIVHIILEDLDCIQDFCKNPRKKLNSISCGPLACCCFNNKKVVLEDAGLWKAHGIPPCSRLSMKFGSNAWFVCFFFPSMKPFLSCFLTRVSSSELTGTKTTQKNPIRYLKEPSWALLSFSILASCHFQNLSCPVKKIRNQGNN